MSAITNSKSSLLQLGVRLPHRALPVQARLGRGGHQRRDDGRPRRHNQQRAALDRGQHALRRYNASGLESNAYSSPAPQDRPGSEGDEMLFLAWDYQNTYLCANTLTLDADWMTSATTRAATPTPCGERGVVVTPSQRPSSSDQDRRRAQVVRLCLRRTHLHIIGIKPRDRCLSTYCCVCDKLYDRLCY